jgi:hypothetical protein
LGSRLELSIGAVFFHQQQTVNCRNSPKTATQKLFNDLSISGYVNHTLFIFMSNNSISTIIKDNEKFSPENYPKAFHELSILNQGIAHVAIYFKVEIIISYLKDHSLKTDWVEANPALARLITSGFFNTSHLESLFESCRNNKVFLYDLEEYMSRLLLIRRN